MAIYRKIINPFGHTVVTTAVLFVNTDVITHVLPSKTSKDKAYNLQV